MKIQFHFCSEFLVLFLGISHTIFAHCLLLLQNYVLAFGNGVKKYIILID